MFAFTNFYEEGGVGRFLRSRFRNGGLMSFHERLGNKGFRVLVFLKKQPSDAAQSLLY